jgi:hypothetical protein
MFHQETTREKGTNQYTLKEDHDNVIILNKSEQGNSLAYTLSRLKRQRTDLYRRVIAGELSANKAAAHAGWRKKPSPLEALRTSLIRWITWSLRTIPAATWTPRNGH